MSDFKGQNVWIIGASSGIGRALALELDQRGANLILSARDTEKLNILNQQLGGRHITLPLDVTKRDDFNALHDLRSTPIDRAIFLAGTYAPMSLDQLDMTTSQQIIATNLSGAMNFIDAILPVMLRQKSGQIALCGSVAGYCGLPHAQPYGATKAAIINLAQSLRAEFISRGIDVRVINPGFVRTPMTDKNDFKMPMRIEPDAAARALANGLLSSHFEIRFPKLFTFLMKILACLPYPLYFRIIRKYTNRSGKNCPCIQ